MTPADPRKLGKLAPRHDPRTLRLAHYLGDKLPAPPPNVGWCNEIKNWGMMGNDVAGDCTIAAAGHAILGWTAIASERVQPTTEEVLAEYAKITGYDPSDPSTDNGAVELDVLNHWRKAGIAGHKIEGYTSIHPHNETELKLAVWFFGSAYLGVALPTRAQDQQVWHIPAGPLTDADEPGSWGGHAVLATAAGPWGVQLITWGATQIASWDWMRTYCDEAYAILSSDWINKAGETMGGVPLASLQHDLAKVGHA